MKKPRIKPPKEDKEEISHVSEPKPHDDEKKETSGDNEFDFNIDKILSIKKKKK